MVPRGVIVWPCLYALHNSVHNWDLPHEFRPVSATGRRLATGNLLCLLLVTVLG